MLNQREKAGAREKYGLEGLKLPDHVAIIMDGNGRWAVERGMKRSAGHRAGVERLDGIIRLSSDIGIDALTLYAFSTENWKRPLEEVNTLCSLFVEFFTKKFDELNANGVVIRGIGDVDAFPGAVSSLIHSAWDRTKDNDGLRLNIAMNYGSHAEILRAVNMAAASGRTDWDEKSFASLLYTHDLPDVDLLIRTGGEQRLSNFLLWQSAYAELMYTGSYWPDFSDEEYASLMKKFAGRSRRYGGLNG